MKKRLGKKANIFVPVGIVLLFIILIIAIVTTGLSLLWLIFQRFLIGAVGAIFLKLGLNFASKKGVKKRK